MMLAYRRGLLEPDYKYGRQSMLREHMILNMLAMECDAKAIENALMIRNVALAPAIDPQKAIEYANSLLPSIKKLAYLNEYNDAKVQTDEEVLAGSAKKLAEAFAVLSERGIIEEFRKRAEEAVNKHLEEQEDL